jgi:5-(carboxyamino)imidazole ribonucleotide synthase
MTVGVVGGGQLGRMLALAGYPLGLDFLFLDSSAATPAGQVAPLLAGAFTDERILGELARRCEVVTFDWENVSVEAMHAHVRGTRIAPRLFESLRIPTTRYADVRSRLALERAAQRIGFPGVLKTRRLGYDGKGQAVIRDRESLAMAWDALGSAPLLYEEFVPFDFEVSVIGARSRSGEIAIYPLCGNVHHDGILRLTRAPFGSPALSRQAAGHLTRVLQRFRYEGILAIEFFVRGGRLVANEMAPRVHNSGHWTIEGAVTSQFENHLRAILGLPLGSSAARGHSAMVNLIGTVPRSADLLALPGVHLHDYGKEPRPRRKVGHLTAVCDSAGARDRCAKQLLGIAAPGLRLRLPSAVH